MLILVLVVLALAGVIMGRRAISSNLLALQANAAQEQLQTRWAALTIQKAILPHCETLLAQAQADSREPIAAAVQQLSLGTLTCTLVVGDEQAKANANALYARNGLQQMEQSVRRLLGQSGANLPVTAGMPEHPVAVSSSSVQAFGAWGQLLPDFRPEMLLPDARADRPLLADLTCWGSGKLNFKRCSAECLEEMTRGSLSLSQQDKLLSLRREVPGISLREALPQLELTDSGRKSAQDVLTDSSSCYSVWIILRSTGRSYYRLAVSEGRSGSSRPKVFVW